MISNWPSLKGLAILKYMVSHHKSPVIKESLMEVFWPYADPESARRNLHQAIYSLRQALRHRQPDFKAVLFENDHYLLNPELTLYLDFEEFEERINAGRRLDSAGHPTEAIKEYSRAEELYKGDFLEEDLYEDWTGALREQIRNAYLDLADRLSSQYQKQGDPSSAIAVCWKILKKDNCNEIAYRRLMQCYQTLGQLSLAVRQYRLCVETLKNELDVPPSSETLNLFEDIIGSGKNNQLAMSSTA
jgi:DNA-binding SARP family transcriptional activator